MKACCKCGVHSLRPVAQTKFLPVPFHDAIQSWLDDDEYCARLSNATSKKVCHDVEQPADELFQEYGGGLTPTDVYTNCSSTMAVACQNHYQ